MLGAVLQKATAERPKRGRRLVRAPVASLGVNVQERIKVLESQDAETSTDVTSTASVATQVSSQTTDAKVGSDQPAILTHHISTQTTVEMHSKECDTSTLEKHIKEAKLKRHMKKQLEAAAAQRLVLGAPGGDESDE